MNVCEFPLSRSTQMILAVIAASAEVRGPRPGPSYLSAEMRVRPLPFLPSFLAAAFVRPLHSLLSLRFRRPLLYPLSVGRTREEDSNGRESDGRTKSGQRRRRWGPTAAKATPPFGPDSPRRRASGYWKGGRERGKKRRFTSLRFIASCVEWPS